MTMDALIIGVRDERRSRAEKLVAAFGLFEEDAATIRWFF
jgi:hypothetical protein